MRYKSLYLRSALLNAMQESDSDANALKQIILVNPLLQYNGVLLQQPKEETQSSDRIEQIFKDLNIEYNLTGSRAFLKEYMQEKDIMVDSFVNWFKSLGSDIQEEDLKTMISLVLELTYKTIRIRHHITRSGDIDFVINTNLFQTKTLIDTLKASEYEVISTSDYRLPKFKVYDLQNKMINEMYIGDYNNISDPIMRKWMSINRAIIKNAKLIQYLIDNSYITKEESKFKYKDNSSLTIGAILNEGNQAAIALLGLLNQKFSNSEDFFFTKGFKGELVTWLSKKFKD